MRALGIVLLCLAAPAFAGPLTQDSPRVNEMTWVDLARAGDRIVAVGERGNVLYSDDEGKTWHMGETPGEPMLTAVCFADGRQGWAVGHDAVVWKTSDGGESWQQQYSDPYGSDGDSGTDGAGSDAAGGDMSDLYSSGGGAGDMSGLYGDGGGDGDMSDLYGEGGDAAGGGGAMAVNTSGAPFLDVWCDTDQHVVAVGGFGYLLETNDGGHSWSKRMDTMDNPDGWHLYAIRPVPRGDGTVLIAGERGTLFRSRDHGNSWSVLDSPYGGTFFGITAAARDTVLVHGLRGNVWLTRDMGESWQRIKTGVTRGINGGAVLDDGSIVLVGNAGVVLTSHDNGSSLSLRYTDERATLSAVLELRDGGVLTAGVSGLARIRDLH